jgi:hypothetical protein
VHEDQRVSRVLKEIEDLSALKVIKVREVSVVFRENRASSVYRERA